MQCEWCVREEEEEEQRPKVAGMDPIHPLPLPLPLPLSSGWCNVWVGWRRDSYIVLAHAVVVDVARHSSLQIKTVRQTERRRKLLLTIRLLSIVPVSFSLASFFLLLLLSLSLPLTALLSIHRLLSPSIRHHSRNSHHLRRHLLPPSRHSIRVVLLLLLQDQQQIPPLPRFLNCGSPYHYHLRTLTLHGSAKPDRRNTPFLYQFDHPPSLSLTLSRAPFSLSLLVPHSGN